MTTLRISMPATKGGRTVRNAVSGPGRRLVRAAGLLPRVALSAALAALPPLVGCGTDETGAPPAYNVSGQWDVSESMVDCDCPNCSPNPPYVLDVTQSGGSLTVDEANLGMTFTGALSGDHINWSGSYPKDGGTTNVHGTDITVTDGGARFSGTASWTWSGQGVSCSGTTRVTGQRQGGANPAPIPGLDEGGEGESNEGATGEGNTATGVVGSSCDGHWDCDDGLLCELFATGWRCVNLGARSCEESTGSCDRCYNQQCLAITADSNDCDTTADCQTGYVCLDSVGEPYCFKPVK